MSNHAIKVHEKDPAYGWVMVFAVFLLSALAFGALGSISVFLKPLSSEFGWSRGETSLGYTVISFSSALFGFCGAILPTALVRAGLADRGVCHVW